MPRLLLEDAEDIILTDDSSVQFQLFYKSFLEMDAKEEAKLASMDQDPPNQNILETHKKLADIKEEISGIDEDLYDYNYNDDDYDMVDDEIGIEKAYDMEQEHKVPNLGSNKDTLVSYEGSMDSNKQLPTDEEQLPIGEEHSTTKEQSKAEVDQSTMVEDSLTVEEKLKADAERLLADAEKLIADDKIFEEATPLKIEINSSEIGRKEKVKKVKKETNEKVNKVKKEKIEKVKKNSEEMVKNTYKKSTNKKETKIETCAVCDQIISNEGNKGKRAMVTKEKLSCAFCNITVLDLNDNEMHYAENHLDQTFAEPVKNIVTTERVSYCLPCYEKAGLDRKKCPIEGCYKYFKPPNNHSSRINEHIEFVHKSNADTKDGGLICDECGDSFPNKFVLKRHLHLQHSGKQCKFCDYKSPHHHQLKEHERKHTGERPEICSFCGKGFSARGTLEAHRRIHTGEKPFKCKFCDLTFAQRNGVNSHAKIHHKDKLGTEKLYEYQRPIKQEFNEFKNELKEEFVALFVNA